MRLPSSRRKKRPEEKLNLVPIMDSVFIFIFFLLMSAQFRQDLAYEEIVKIMDSVRMLKKTDDAFFRKGKDGLDVKIMNLFDKIIFGNLMS